MIASSLWPKAVEIFGRYQAWILAVLAGLCVIDLAWMGGSYLLYPGYLDHGEPSISLIAWRLLDGVPAYQAFDAPGRVSNVYGPLSYLLHVPFFFVFGPLVTSGKAASIVAAMVLPVLMFLDHRRNGFSIGSVALVLGASFLLFNTYIVLFSRPDAALAVLVAGAVWVKNASQPGAPEWGRTIIIGVIGGLAVSLKIHGAIFIAPVALVYCLDRGDGPRAFFLACITVSGVALGVALAPFALPLFSLGDYLSWFGPMSGKPEPLQQLTRLLRYSVLYVVPVALLFYFSRSQRKKHDRLCDRTYFGAYLVCLAMAIFLGSKPGADIHYMFPFSAIIVDLMLRHGRRIAKRKDIVWAAIGGVTALMLALGVPVQKRFLRAMDWDEATRITAEIRQIMLTHPDLTLEMGLGENITTYKRTWFKTLPVLAGNPYTLDTAIVMETSLLKIPLTDDTLAMIRGCSTDLWLVPKGERPFEMIGYYGIPVFDEAFKEAFFSNYENRESSTFYDLWRCKR
ncbi:MAG: hypothetical protein O3B76_04620 [Proteobacteria bacterium]|nr:hypothetical protein [Pseudomonadota bacterium]